MLFQIHRETLLQLFSLHLMKQWGSQCSHKFIIVIKSCHSKVTPIGEFHAVSTIAFPASLFLKAAEATLLYCLATNTGVLVAIKLSIKIGQIILSSVCKKKESYLFGIYHSQYFCLYLQKSTQKPKGCSLYIFNWAMYLFQQQQTLKRCQAFMVRARLKLKLKLKICLDEDFK